MSTPGKIAALLTIAIWLAACGSAPASNPPATVAEVDLQRYLGVWHEFARYENDFQDANCVNVTAEYALDADGDVLVFNTCRSVQGATTETAKGWAYVADTKTNAKLRVTFFWPFFGDYWIVALANDYVWVIVSDPGREYLWILTRQPMLAGKESAFLTDRAASLGFDLAKLRYTQVRP